MAMTSWAEVALAGEVEMPAPAERPRMLAPTSRLIRVWRPGRCNPLKCCENNFSLLPAPVSSDRPTGLPMILRLLGLGSDTKCDTFGGANSKMLHPSLVQAKRAARATREARPNSGPT